MSRKEASNFKEENYRLKVECEELKGTVEKHEVCIAGLKEDNFANSMKIK